MIKKSQPRDSLIGGLSGCTFPTWLRILARNRFSISPQNWGRVAHITHNSVKNSIRKRREDEIYADEIEKVNLYQPVFVLGIWRSGTTHLHNLLSLDDRFGFANTYQVCFPHTFLSTESYEARNLKPFGPAVRRMDNVKAGFDRPQEDEFALSAQGLSYLISIFFPRTGGFYRRFLTLRGTTSLETDRWKSMLCWFLRKVTLKTPKPLVLKSPAHTSRIKYLLQLFPDAKFVHIHRHPATVMRSIFAAGSKVPPYWMLQNHAPDPGSTVAEYKEVYDSFFEQKGLIKNGHFCEIAFEDLERDPVDQLAYVYDTLNLPSFDYVMPALTPYLRSIADYKRNKLPSLPPEVKNGLASVLATCYQEWGYEVDDGVNP